MVLLNPIDEFILFSIERVKEHHAAHPFFGAAQGKRISRRQIAPAISDDNHRHPAERGARRLGIEPR